MGWCWPGGSRSSGHRLSDLERIVLDIYAAADLKTPPPEILTRATDALIGLAAFPAEQALAMSLTPKGLDTSGLWERKRKLIEQTPGLSIWRGKDSFDQIGGADNIKQFLTSVFNGIDPPRVIGFIDEIEKAFAGFGTDSSGVKTDMTGTMLSLMQDLDVDGCLFLGPPGCAKSAVGKSAGNLAGKLTIGFDFSAMQNSEVGNPRAQKARTNHGNHACRKNRYGTVSFAHNAGSSAVIRATVTPVIVAPQTSTARTLSS